MQVSTVDLASGTYSVQIQTGITVVSGSFVIVR